MICTSSPFKYLNRLFVILAFITTSSCSSIKTAIYDQYSFQKTVEIKVLALKLMDKATTPYTQNTSEINHVVTEIDKIVEYEKNKPDNEITYAMWQLINNPNNNLWAGFLKFWKDNNILSDTFIKEAKTQIAETLDMLLHYESKKDKEAKAGLLEMISGT